MALLNRGPVVPDEFLAAKSEFDQLAIAASERIGRMKTYREEGNRVRDPQITAGAGEREDYGQRRTVHNQPRRHKLTLPLGKALTLKHAYRIAGQLPDVVVEARADTDQERYRSDTMEKIVWAIMRASHGETTFSSASWNASEVGSACFDLYWDMKRQMPVLRAVDPASILEVQGSDDPHDFQRIYRSWVAPVFSVQAEYREMGVDVEALTANLELGMADTVRIVQVCDRQKILRFADCGHGKLVPLLRHVHGYGFVPYVIIPNLGPYDDVWGWADYEFIRVVADYIQLLFSREADVLKAVAAGAYIEKGTGKSSNEIRDIIRQGGVVTAKREGEVTPIEAAQMPTFAEAHADRAMQLFKMLGAAPDAAWGLPGSGSGTDRGLQLQPLLEYTAMKQLNWQHGLGRLFGMAFQMIEQKLGKTMNYRGAKPGKGGRRLPFIITLSPDGPPDLAASDLGGVGQVVELPKTPKDLFDGDYEVRFVWRNRVDPEDPQYVMSEMNKFTQGAQSLQTTLENLGFQDPEEEMRRIEKEAEKFPWVNQGLVSLLLGQLRGNAQGQGGGNTFDQSGAVAGAMETMAGMGGGGQSGALNADAGTSVLGPAATGTPYGGA